LQVAQNWVLLRIFVRHGGGGVQGKRHSSEGTGEPATVAAAIVTRGS
jgi:hypothetical protein